MKNKTFSLLVVVSFLLFASNLIAQNNPIDFETGGYGLNWTWTVFENNTNPPLEIVTNPDMSGANTSLTVAKFTALQSGNPWAGCESAHGTSDLGTFVLNENNSLIKIMVWKSVISDVGIKLVSANGWSQGELKVPNTQVNQWEELTFDFSGYLNPPASEGQLDQIVVFPDFDLAGRTQDNIIYFDNIYFSTTVSDVNEFQDVFPSDYALKQNYPNPFNPSTNIRFNLPEANRVILKVYDMLGQDVGTLVNEFMNAGAYEIAFDAQDLPTGMYFYSISAGNFNSVKKMILIK